MRRGPGLHIIVVSLLLVLFGVPAWAGEAFHGIPYEVLRTQAADGAELTLIHLLAPPNRREAVLLEPGLLENAAALDGLARAFHSRGYEVYVGQVRLAGMQAAISGHAPRNGLEEVFYLDFPAHLREVIRRCVGCPVHLVGHSLGGLEILAALSDGELAREFGGAIRAVSLLAAPHSLDGMPRWARLASRVLLPTLRGAQELGGRTLPWPPGAGIFLDRFLLGAGATGKSARRAFLRDEVSRFPVELLADFARAAQRGHYLRRNGGRAIVPERIVAPVQVVGVEDDFMAPPASQRELYERLASARKRFVMVRGFRHVDLVTAEAPVLLREIVGFHESPEGRCGRLLL